MAQTKVPDGKGGWTTTEGALISGSKARPDKQAEAMSAMFNREAGLLTERMTAFVNLYVEEKALTKEHIVFAHALLSVQLREKYPDGTDAFDVVAAEAAAYYDAHKEK